MQKAKSLIGYNFSPLLVLDHRCSEDSKKDGHAEFISAPHMQSLVFASVRHAITVLWGPETSQDDNLLIFRTPLITRPTKATRNQIMRRKVLRLYKKTLQD